jgi:hypothetical protein
MKEIYCCILNCRFSNEITLLERMHMGRFEESGQRLMEIHGKIQNSSKLILFEIIQVEINRFRNYLRNTTSLT